mmetsp:Transcript_25481/g.70042  ORF Transcript_25481/g.70042 Transcript_25481/m.70042 type:complete len:236 (+) Transcript_25481:292-999(+)
MPSCTCCGPSLRRQGMTSRAASMSSPSRTGSYVPPLPRRGKSANSLPTAFPMRKPTSTGGCARWQVKPLVSADSWTHRASSQRWCRTRCGASCAIRPAEARTPPSGCARRSRARSGPSSRRSWRPCGGVARWRLAARRGQSCCWGNARRSWPARARSSRSSTRLCARSAAVELHARTRPWRGRVSPQSSCGTQAASSSSRPMRRRSGSATSPPQPSTGRKSWPRSSPRPSPETER